MPTPIIFPLSSLFGADDDAGGTSPFMAAMKPDGLYLCIPAEESIQPDILKRLEKW